MASRWGIALGGQGGPGWRGQTGGESFTVFLIVFTRVALTQACPMEVST